MVEVTPLVPTRESNVVTLTIDPIVAVLEPPRGVNPTSSERVSENKDQSEDSSTEPMTELFPQTVDSFESIVASTKGRKSRKKSDKTLEARSAIETSGDTSEK